MKREQFSNMIIGSILGDVLGIPYEFRSKQDVVSTISNVGKAIQSGGFHQQEAGVWSDDSSLLLATIDNMDNVLDMATAFTDWYYDDEYCTDRRFDCGNTTREAIQMISCGYNQPTGGTNHVDNGNGSLMRIAGIFPKIIDLSLADRYELVKRVSSITHAHNISIGCCFIFTEFMRNLYLNPCTSKTKALMDAVHLYEKVTEDNNIEGVADIFNMVSNIQEYSSRLNNGYVVITLACVIESILKTDNFEDAIVDAVCYGGDTDTIACIVGAVAGLMYGLKDDGLTGVWLSQLKRKDYLLSIINDSYDSFVGGAND